MNKNKNRNSGEMDNAFHESPGGWRKIELAAKRNRIDQELCAGFATAFAAITQAQEQAMEGSVRADQSFAGEGDDTKIQSFVVASLSNIVLTDKNDPLKKLTFYAHRDENTKKYDKPVARSYNGSINELRHMINDVTTTISVNSRLPIVKPVKEDFFMAQPII